MEALLHDIRYSLRQFRRAPLFVGAVVATLALAIGANALLFGIANAAFFQGLPYPDSSRLVSMSMARKGEDIGRIDESTAHLAIAANLPVFDSLAMYNSASATLVGGEYPERLIGARVSASFFDVLAVRPGHGRTFTAEESRTGGPAAVLLSDAVWTRVFGRRATIVGETITLDDRGYEVVGVMPPGFSYPGRSEFWLAYTPRATTGATYFVDFIGRLRPSATVGQAGAALGALRQSRKQELPAAARQSEVRVMPLHQRLYGDFRRPVVLLFGTAVCVLLIGCANIANLLLARNAARGGELALRVAVGASRRRLFRQLLVENLLLAGCGALPGIALALLGMEAFRTFGPPALARLPTLAIDSQVLLFTLVATIGTGLLFGLAPAFGAARIGRDHGLSGGRIADRESRWRPRRVLVVLEIAAAVVLTLGAGLLVKSFARFQAVDRGFHADNVLTASLTLSTIRYPDAASRRAFFDSLLERLRGLAAVESVAVGSGLNSMSMTMDWPPDGERRDDVWEIAVDDGVGDGHFRTFGIAIQEGRECAGHADASGAVINAAMARRAYGARSPIGEPLNLATVGLGTRAVLGVAADVPDIRTKAAARPTVYTCAGTDRAASATVALRARGDEDAAALAAALRTAVRELDPAQPVSRVITVDQIVRDGMSSRWFDAFVIGALSTLALVLALGGLYAVTAYSVARRTREIGIRLALGADRATVMRLVLRQSGILVVAGTCIGVLAAVPLVRFVSAMLFDVQPLDPAVFSVVAVLVAAVAMLATLVPARRASRVDPMLTLRAE
jgi:putative ABC transport system permease protein